MASGLRYLFVGLAVGTVAFFAGVFYMIYGVLSDSEPEYMWMLVGMVFMVVLPVVGIYFDKRTARKARGAPVRQTEPLALRYESGAPNYCPVCHSNLGPNPPQICPECGYRRRTL